MKLPDASGRGISIVGTLPNSPYCAILLSVFIRKGDYMSGLVEIIAAVIGLLLLTSVVLFVYSFIGKWNMALKVYFGLAVFLFTHLLLFYLITFGDSIPLPAILTKYSVGMLNLLTKLLPI